MNRFPAFGYPDYRRLWLAAAFHQQGMMGEQVVLGLLVFRLSGSTAWVGAILAVYFVPFFVFGVLSGAVADRVERRTLLRVVELAIIVNFCWFASILSFGAPGFAVIVVYALLSGTLRALHQPVRASYAYDIVGETHVVSALGLLNVSSRAGTLVGAIVAGAVMDRYGAASALFALAPLHGISLLLFVGLRSAGQAAVTERAPIRQNLREYAHELRHNRILLMLMVVTASVEIFGFSFATALPELASGRLEMGAEGLGLLQGARAAGGIVAGIAFALAITPRRHGPTYLGVIFAFGSGLMLLSLDGPLATTMAAVFFVATIAVSSDILTQSMMQLSVGNALRGRAMGVWVLALGFGPLGHVEIGLLSVYLGVDGALLVNGLVLLAIGLFVAVAAPGLRRL